MVPGRDLGHISMGLREGSHSLALGGARLERVLAQDPRLRLRQRNRVGGVCRARYFDLAQEMRLFAAEFSGAAGKVLSSARRKTSAASDLRPG
jgi:hypothetical protein